MTRRYAIQFMICSTPKTTKTKRLARIRTSGLDDRKENVETIELLNTKLLTYILYSTTTGETNVSISLEYVADKLEWR